MTRTRRWYLIWSARLGVFRMRHLSRRPPLQRDWESGDPVRVARVQHVADAIIRELEEGNG